MKIGEELDDYYSACYVLKEEVLQSVRAFMEDEKRESFFAMTLRKKIQGSSKELGITWSNLSANY